MLYTHLISFFGVAGLRFLRPLCAAFSYQATASHQPALPAPYNLSVVTLGNAPFLTDRVQDTFFEDNPLIAATLQSRTQQKYGVALENLRTSTFASISSALPLDHRLYIYIHGSYTKNSNPGNRQEMTNLLSIILIMYPSLQGANLDLPKRCLSGWRTLHPSKSSAPFTEDISLALAWRMLARGRIEAALTVLLTFSACLRVSDPLALKMQDIALPGDVCLAAYEALVAGLNIRDVKTARYTGRLQFVKLEDLHTIKLLQAWKSALKRDTGPLVTLTYQSCTTDLKAAFASIALHNVSFTPNSARIGKATHDFISGVTVSQVAVNGRWKSLNFLRYYVTNGRAWLLDTNISREAQNPLIESSISSAPLPCSNSREHRETAPAIATNKIPSHVRTTQ